MSEYRYTYSLGKPLVDRFEDCTFDREYTNWVCEGKGSLLGDRTYARGLTKTEAYANYVKQVRKDDYEQRNGIQDQ